MPGRRTLTAGFAAGVVVGVAVLLAAPHAMAGTCTMAGPFGPIEYECDNGDPPSKDAPWWATEEMQVAYAAIGGAGTLGAAGYGVFHIRQKRMRLATYLRTLDETYAQHKARPGEGLAKLVPLRQEIRSLFRAHKLDDAHYLELDKRATDAILKLRNLELQVRYPELPPVVHAQLRQLLHDGVVSEADVALVDRTLASHFVPGRTRDDLIHLLRAWSREDEPEPAAAPPGVEAPGGADVATPTSPTGRMALDPSGHEPLVRLEERR